MNGAAMYASVQTGDTQDRVLQHAPLVKRIAYHLLGRLPDTVLVDDLIQAGMLGLLEAMKNYDASQGASFDTYAGIRIRGAMLDEVRRSDWTPRSVHKKARMVAEAIHDVENKLGHDARESDVAEHLGISPEEYRQILQDSVGCKTFSVEELGDSGDAFLQEAQLSDMQPVDHLLQENFHQALADAIKKLPERERLVVSLYYDEELNLREIGQVLEVSESRVSQICSQAMLRLRARLADWVQGNDNKQDVY
ncbi:RNA polymerase sigma factor FliA [Methylomarinum sp. Ch1-1]|uniref:RNA polymerase sigma factor FliA n=1 Tax=Methylomarinum roseum TaxID=3067653 RepID=A0AAU7NU86_9GAMM|nr:RNA polymerase sigma factor FliA [Methylomarinum sp. Ch1-1]MDP4519370.1 RNA polymerase sigma factor FliA [Methylomarinum sp. Ch1-1]